MVSSMMNFSRAKLSKRLSLFASYYQDQDIIWDIGCDHGHLGLSFINHPKNPLIHLVDPARPVIEKLQNKLIDSDIPRLSIFHQQGQEVILSPMKSHFIFIAGMGGLEIIDILSNLFPQLKNGDQVLISPHNKVLEVRAFLQQQGKWLESERVLVEAGIWYPHFLLAKEAQTCSEFGEEIFKGEEGHEYRAYLMEQLSRHRDTRSKEFLNFLCRL